MRTLEQEMSAYVYGQVSKRRDLDGRSKHKKYGVWCHGLPGLIRQCGLAQAVAFLVAKEARDEGGDEQAYGWLLEDLKDVPGIGAPCTLLSYVQTVDAATYLMATRRIQLALVYFKRFAESVLEVKAEDWEEGE